MEKFESSEYGILSSVFSLGEGWDCPKLDTVVFAEKMYSALEGADFLVIATEWPEFRTPDFGRIDGLLAEKVIFDGRNVFEMDTMRKHGYTYYSIGRQDIK